MDHGEAAAILEADPDYRILRRIPPIAEWPLARGGSGVQRYRALFIDTETTGLDLERDEVIELALLPFEYERDTGAITRILEDEAYSGLRQPSVPIPTDVARVHGITDAAVAGRSIDDEIVNRLIGASQVILAHNAAFDRPMVEKLWPAFERTNWACSLSDIDWRAEGLSSAKLDFLLMQQGWFYDGHRALSDALAGAFLLSRPLPVSGGPALQTLLECARRPLKAVRAEGAPFEARAALKQRGYRWDPGDEARSKAWWVLTDDSERELAWLQSEIYDSPVDLPVTNVPPTRRFSSRVWH